VDIPIEELLLRQRAKTKALGLAAGASVSFGAWALVASEPLLWRAALASGKLIESLPESLRPPVLRGWEANHVLPRWRGGAFRRWLANRGNTWTDDDPPDDEAEGGVS
jgi:hypothetical protein